MNVFLDGLKEKDRSNLMNTILSVATIKDNTYHLMRHVWNDVQEDWPFYTEQDKQMLKRYIIIKYFSFLEHLYSTLFEIFIIILLFLFKLLNIYVLYFLFW